jgi:hypothetical protein
MVDNIMRFRCYLTTYEAKIENCRRGQVVFDARPISRLILLILGCSEIEVFPETMYAEGSGVDTRADFKLADDNSIACRQVSIYDIPNLARELE